MTRLPASDRGPAHTGPALAAAVADDLWAALGEFASLPGGRVEDAGDARLILADRPWANFNNVIATAIDESGADARIPALLRSIPAGCLPLTWWAGPTTRPGDLFARLGRLGLVRQEPEFGMVLDLRAGWMPAPLAAGATIETVEDLAQLDEFLDVMNSAYGWPDPARTALIRAMYAADLRRPPADRRTVHWLIRAGGRAVASSSLFVAEGHGFVTNIGTRPDARGQGFASAATVATLQRAHDLGRTVATLTASVDGRSVYRRLGFVDTGVMERFVATADIVARVPGR